LLFYYVLSKLQQREISRREMWLGVCPWHHPPLRWI
jgi:hypothetical protein